MNKQKKMYRTVFGLLLGVMILCWNMGSRGMAADDIYVSGAPDAWPLEYYDEQSGTYKGVWPELLQRAADTAGLTIHYVEASPADARLSLAENLQVDAVSSMDLNETQLERAGLTLGNSGLTYTEDAQRITLGLAYTESMPAASREALETALAQTDPAYILGLYMKYAAMGNRVNRWTVIFFVLSCILLVTAILLVFMFLHKRRTLLKTLYVDEETGTDNFQSWKVKYERQITNENCQHYAVLYFYTGIENITRIYGLREANRTLKLVAQACGDVIRSENEAFARFNEFNFVFFVQYTQVKNIQERLQTIYNTINEQLRIQQKKYFLELHTGIYCLTSIDTDPLRAVQFSEVTMEYARQNALDCSVYSELIEQKTIAGYSMEHEVIHGMIHQEFIMYLQPVVSLETGNICGAEALVRWQHPLRGLMGPEDFLYIMKRKQLTGKLNMDIFTQGCRLLKEQRAQGRTISMIFNFTAENVGDSQFAEILKSTVEEYGLSPKQILVQLNQVVEISRTSTYMKTLHQLAEYGFDVYLAGLELDRVFFDYLDCNIKGVKLRRELICQVERPEGRKVVAGIVNFCHDLGLKVLCTGIESEAQAETLRKMGCEFGSGFHFYYPLSLEAFELAVEAKQKS